LVEQDVIRLLLGGQPTGGANVDNTIAVDASHIISGNESNEISGYNQQVVNGLTLMRR
jgi:hypothetical protein